MLRLRKFLDDSGLTQAALAERIGVKQPTVWGWLHGEIKPTAANLVVLSEVTGISIDELLSEPRTRLSTTNRKTG